MDDSRIAACEKEFLQSQIDRAEKALQNSYQYVPENTPR
jgi:hypothetical protein